MDILTTIHTIDRNAVIAESDPHGIIISVISILIVFISLIILYLTYTLIGHIVNRWFINHKDGKSVVKEKGKPSGQEVHDMESYTLTIMRKGPVQKTIDRGIRLNTYAMAEEEATIAQQSRISTPSDGVVRSPLPGTILKVSVKEGDKVKTGQEVAILEAMKMENTIEAERDGVVKKIHVSQGDSIPEGGEILTIE